jgi:hypothetical protein
MLARIRLATCTALRALHSSEGAERIGQRSVSVTSFGESQMLAEGDLGRQTALLTLFTVLDGAPHTGTVLDLAATTTKWPLGGKTYAEVDGLHAHEQHDQVRCFRVVNGPNDTIRRAV